jgi:hypothetical protein
VGASPRLRPRVNAEQALYEAALSHLILHFLHPSLLFIYLLGSA